MEAQAQLPECKLSLDEFAELLCHVADLRSGFIDHSRGWQILNTAMVDLLAWREEIVLREGGPDVGASAQAERATLPH